MMLDQICQDHQLVLSSYVMEEMYTVIRKKWPSRVTALDRFFAALAMEIEHTPERLPNHGWFTIRDPKDEKVMYSAITADVDILITGDKDFRDIVIEKPVIMDPAEYIKRYMSS